MEISAWLQRELNVCPDTPQFLLYFEAAKESLPRLFEVQWYRWEVDHFSSVFRVYSLQGRCVFEVRRLASDYWMGWLVMADVKIMSAREQSLRRVFVRVGLLPH